jgi:hypothetical protein
MGKHDAIYRSAVEAASDAAAHRSSHIRYRTQLIAQLCDATVELDDWDREQLRALRDAARALADTADDVLKS